MQNSKTPYLADRGRFLARRMTLHPARTDFPRSRGAPSRFLPGRFLGRGSGFPSAAAFFTAAGLLVHGLPGAFLGRLFGGAALLVAFLDVFGLAFLFVGIFGLELIAKVAQGYFGNEFQEPLAIVSKYGTGPAKK